MAASDWDLSKPIDHSLNSTWPDEVRNLKDLLKSRLLMSDTEPAARTDGVSFTSDDLGSIWIDSNSTPDNIMYVLTATTPTWTPISTAILALATFAILGDATVAGDLTMATGNTLTTEIIKAVDATGIAITDKDDVAMVTLLDGGTIDVSASSIIEESLDGTADMLVSSAAIKAVTDTKRNYVIANGATGTTVFNSTLSVASTFEDLDIGATITDLASGGLAFLEVSTADAQAPNDVYIVKPKGFGVATFNSHYKTSTILAAGMVPMNFDNPSYYYTMATVDANGLVSHGCTGNDVTIVVKVVGYIAT